MANQTVTKTPEYWGNGSSWSSSNVSTARVAFGMRTAPLDAYPAAYKITTPVTAVSACSLKVRLITPFAGTSETVNVTCVATGKRGSSSVWTMEQAFDWNIRADTDHTFSFSAISGGDVDAVEFRIWQTGPGELIELPHTTAPTASYTFTPPTLGLRLTPTSLYTGETVKGTIQEPFGQTFTVRFYVGSNTLQTFTTSSSSFTQTADASWFTKAGETGDTLRVSVSVSDGIGRSASGR